MTVLWAKPYDTNNQFSLFQLKMLKMQGNFDNQNINLI